MLVTTQLSKRSDQFKVKEVIEPNKILSTTLK